MFVMGDEDLDSGLLDLEWSYEVGWRVGEVWFLGLPNLRCLPFGYGLGDKSNECRTPFTVHKEGEESRYVS